MITVKDLLSTCAETPDSLSIMRYDEEECFLLDTKDLSKAEKFYFAPVRIWRVYDDFDNLTIWI